MHIVTIIPFTKIPFPAPQTLDYFSNQKVEVGGIVEVKISSRKLLAIVVACSEISGQKLRIKKSPYRLRPIEQIINANCVYPKHYLKLLLWASSYYYSPTGLIAKTLFPQIFSRPTEKFKKELASIGAPALKKAVEKSAPETAYAIVYASRTEKNLSSDIEKILSENKAVLFLVPELYKIDYYRDKISSLKNAAIAHSKLTPKMQSDTWKEALSGKIKLVIGTRAALSIHLKNLGLIIVDEEESPYHKSFDQQPYINTRETALKLAELAGAKVILTNDLPSLESWRNVIKGRYKTMNAKSENATTIARTKLETIDMREELKNGNYSIFSKKLQGKLKEAISKNKQALLFINRRGLATGLLCRDCGHTIKCPNCDIPMIYHKNYKLQTTNYKLICHHCSRTQNPPSVCPQCQSYRIKFIGSGTQRIAQEFEKFCDANGLKSRSAIVDTEHTKTWEEQKRVFDLFKDKKIAVLIGTQLMLKPSILPKIDFAAAITVDPMLSIPDFRMNERIFRIASKLRKRASSEVILQTYNPDNPSLQSVIAALDKKNSFKIFAKNELETRKTLSYPPFSQIIKLSYSHTNQAKAEQEAKVLLNKLKLQAANCKLQTANYQILGPAPAFIPRENNRYTWHIMIKSKIENLALRNKLLRVVPKEWRVDVDPVEML